MTAKRSSCPSALDAGAVAGERRAHARVVDEHVEPVGAGVDAVGEVAHLGERGEVGSQPRDAIAVNPSRRGSRRRPRAPASSRPWTRTVVARRAARGERTAEAVGRTRDEDGRIGRLCRRERTGHARPFPTPASESAQRVTALELFFDLVFVFAITQVTGFISAQPDVAPACCRPAAILAVLWWAWSALRVARQHGRHPTTARCASSLLTAMAAMLVASLAVPDAFGSDAVVFGARLPAVRVAARRRLRRCSPAPTRPCARSSCGLRGRCSPSRCCSCARRARPTSRRAPLLDRGDRHRLRRPDRAAPRAGASRPAHFAERYGLIVIIALGESIVALGVGA